MKKFFTIALCLISLFAFGKCERCKDKGYFENWWMCPLCRGYYFISPAWFDMSTGNTRWTETTYFTGLQTKSDIRKKMFSFKKCPLCDNSMKKGGLKFVYICSCENKIKMKVHVENAKNELFKLCKKVRITSTGSVVDFKINDWRALNAWIHLKKTSARGEVLRKLIYEYTSEDFFDIEAADYRRDESKYQRRIFSQTDNERNIKDGDYVINISSDFNDESNIDKTEKTNEIIINNSSYIAPKMFKASMPKMKPVEYVCDCEIDDYYNYEFDECERTHWSVSIRAYTSDGEDWESFHGYVLKSSSIGKKISSILSDGKEHKMTLVIRFTKKAEPSTNIVEIIDMK